MQSWTCFAFCSSTGQKKSGGNLFASAFRVVCVLIILLLQSTGEPVSFFVRNEDKELHHL